MDGQVTWSDLGFSFGRTLSEHSAAIEEKTSQPCWKKLRVSQNQDFLYLDCRTSKNGQKQEPLTVMGGLSRGELTTLAPDVVRLGLLEARDIGVDRWKLIGKALDKLEEEMEK